MSTPSSQNSTGGPEDIAPELLERLLLRKLDMLERDYSTTLRAQRHADNDGVDVEIAALRMQQQQQHASSASATQPAMTTKSSSAVSVPDELSFDFPAPPSAPLPQANIDKVKSLMGGLSLKAPSWLQNVPDDALMSTMLNQIHGSVSSSASTAAKPSTASKKKSKKKEAPEELVRSHESNSAVHGDTDVCLSVTAVVPTPEVAATVSRSHSNSVFARYADRYLPWTCPICTFRNESYPSTCEACEQPNELYVPVPLTMSTTASAAAAVSHSTSASSTSVASSGNMPKDARSLFYFETAVRRSVEKDALNRVGPRPNEQGYQHFGTSAASSYHRRGQSSCVFVAPSMRDASSSHAPGEFVSDEFAVALLPVAAAKQAVSLAPDLLPAPCERTETSVASLPSALPGAAPKCAESRAPSSNR